MPNQRSITLAAMAALVLAGVTPAPGTGQVDARERIVAAQAPARGWLGISLTAAREPGESIDRVVITDVWDSSPAAAAGLRAGDRIMKVNGADVSADRFRSMTQRLAPGDPMALEVLRDGRAVSLTVVAGDRPDAEAIMPLRIQEELDAVKGRLDRILAASGVEVVVEGTGGAGRSRLMAPTIVVERLDGDTLTTRVILGADTAESAVHIRAHPEGTGYRIETVTASGEGRTPLAIWVQADSAALRMTEQALVTASAQARSRERDAWARALEADATARPLAPYLAGLNRVAGAEMREMNPGLASYFGVSQGLLVTEVVEGTPAAESGLRGGDVIVSAGGTPVTTVRGLREALARGRPDTVLQVVRRGERMELRLR